MSKLDEVEAYMAASHDEFRKAMAESDGASGAMAGPLMAFAVGDVVQLDPVKTENPMFAACMLTVTEVKPWGVQGFVQSLGEGGKPGGQAYYRAKTGTFVRVGKAEWVAA